MSDVAEHGSREQQWGPGVKNRGLTCILTLDFLLVPRTQVTANNWGLT
jgi:hypothetical protein